MDTVALVGHGGKFGDIEVGVSAQVLIAFRDLGVDGGDVDLDVDGAGGRIGPGGEGSRDFVEAAANQADDVMTRAEVGEGVGGVDCIDAGSGKAAAGHLHGRGHWRGH